MAEPRALIALLLLAIVVLHFFVGERARKHAFSRDPPPRPAPRWRLRQALVGDEEEVFTTPARLLAAVELAIKEVNAGGDDVATVEELRSLRAEVAQRCDFLN